MPVRFLNSSVLTWPDRATVERALHAWAREEIPGHSGVVRAGYFGSYARGDWGVGSDIDLIAVVANSSESFERRSLTWELTHLPVPAQLLVYTSEEWDRLLREEGRFARTLEREAIWIFPF
jgi:uncharacterized protein